VHTLAREIEIVAAIALRGMTPAGVRELDPGEAGDVLAEIARDPSALSILRDVHAAVHGRAGGITPQPATADVLHPINILVRAAHAGAPFCEECECKE
jgi:hypothetical protein